MEDSSNDAHGYVKFARRSRRKHELNGMNTVTPPVDAYNAVYLSFVLGGAGFLLPYNSFIMAMDYFKIRYPGTPVVFEMSMVYIGVACITVLGHNGLVEAFSLNSRINFGYVMSFFTLIFVVTCEVWWEAFGTSTSYDVNLTAVALVAIGCTVQQSSFYGYTSMLPTKYTQAVMIGESASGVFTSLIRVLTRTLVPEIRGSTIYFFTVSVSSVATCFAMYHLIRRTDFIQFYIAMCERDKLKITLEPSEDAILMDTNEVQYGVIKLQSPPTSGNNLSFANPLYEPSSTTTTPAPTYKVEDVVIRGRQSVSTSGGLGSIKRGLHTRWEITKIIYPHMISICVVYFTTLSLYPGIFSEIVSCDLGSWMPIYLMALFNLTDLLGKILASSWMHWSGVKMIRYSTLRLILIPMFVLCVAPRASPVISSEIAAYILASLLGYSNGVLGSLPMIQAATKVDDRHRELTGNLMTLLYNVGLTAGSLMAYFLLSIINPIGDHPCGSIAHLPPGATTPIFVNITSTSTFPPTLATTILTSLTSIVTENVTSFN